MRKNPPTRTPKYISWSETAPGRGAVVSKMHSKEYRRFKSKGGIASEWPGTRNLLAADKKTGREFIRNGVPEDVLNATSGPTLNMDATYPNAGYHLPRSQDPVLNLQYCHKSSIKESREYVPESGDDTYEDRAYPSRGDAYARIPICLLEPLGAPVHLRLYLVLVRHTAMRSTPRLKLRRDMWVEAGIHNKSDRSRAVLRLEAQRAIRVDRAPGKSSTVTLNIDHQGMPRLWKVTA